MRKAKNKQEKLDKKCKLVNKSQKKHQKAECLIKALIKLNELS